jgi:hypothetical protein
MHLLHQILDADTILRDIVDNLSNQISGNPFKQALILDLNPYWLAAFRFEQAGLSDDLLWKIPWVFRSGAFFGATISKADLTWSSKAAHGFTQSIFGPHIRESPFLLRIFAYPADGLPTRSPGADQSVYDSGRNRLVEAARVTPIPTIVETHPPAHLIAASGDRVFSPNGGFGTLGGFLEDRRSGSTYGVTCGHVIAAGEARTRAGLLGQVVHSASPVPLPPGGRCDRGCHDVTDLDVALVNLQSPRAIYTAASVVETISPGNIVEMNGTTSRHKRYEVGPAVVDIEIEGTCWNRLFLIHAPASKSVLEPAVNVWLTPPPAPGDSGAWLLRNGNQWAGMVVASHPLYGYALAGTTIVANSNRRFLTDLTLPDVRDSEEEQIRLRAYELWEQNGKPEGREKEFWRQAERELQVAAERGDPAFGYKRRFADLWSSAAERMGLG